MSRQEFLDAAIVPIEPLMLVGNAAEEFIRQLFFPTVEEIAEHNRIIDRIDREIEITPIDDGFMAEVSWLDLSFLDSM